MAWRLGYWLLASDPGRTTIVGIPPGVIGVSPCEPRSQNRLDKKRLNMAATSNAASTSCPRSCCVLTDWIGQRGCDHSCET
jgi:hypothetical protein